MRRKIIFFCLTAFFGAFVGISIDRTLQEKEVIIGNEELLGEENNFGTTVAIYVEQNEGQGDYIQKNNVPTENIYVVNSRTHCVGGGI